MIVNDGSGLSILFVKERMHPNGSIDFNAAKDIDKKNTKILALSGILFCLQEIYI